MSPALRAHYIPLTKCRGVLVPFSFLPPAFQSGSRHRPADAKNRAQLGDAVSSSGAQRSTLRRSLAHMAQHDPWEYLLSARHRHFASQAVALTAALFTDEESTGEGDAGEASHTAGQQIVRFSKALLVLFAETAALLNRAADIVKSKERVESTDARLCSPQAGGPSFAAELAAVLQSLGNQIEQLSFQIFTTNSSQVGLYQALAADTARATAAVLLDSSCYSDPFVRDLGSDAYFLGHRVPSWSTVLQRERHDRMLESVRRAIFEFDDGPSSSRSVLLPCPRSHFIRILIFLSSFPHQLDPQLLCSLASPILFFPDPSPSLWFRRN